ncbi:MAG: excinuclease ABC subunit UvrA [Bacteroidales bacterium]|nr:excinuclease ABC subunit UvrA [Candidatus Scybalousia scybalohippi]
MKKTTDNSFIVAKGIKVNNLKNISVSIPQNSFTVVTGVSGSGKSSLAFDTLFAEGQRRYIESLSSYARQFIGRMPKPEVEKIEGIPPAIAVHQRTINRNPRSTVGTMTEIYEYLKLLYTKIGKTFSPVSGMEVKRDSVSNVVDAIMENYANEKTYILCPVLLSKKEKFEERLNVLLQLGYTRLFLEGEIERIDTILQNKDLQKKYKKAYLLVDRLSVKGEEEQLRFRLAESVHTAFNESNGDCVVWCENRSDSFSNRFERDGIEFVKPTENFFSFNNNYGACPTCQGIGMVEGISEDLVITKPYLSVYEDVVNCWKGMIMGKFKEDFINKAYRKFPIHKPYNELTEEQRDFLWNGDKNVIGINKFFDLIKKESYKVQYRVQLARYRGRTTCPDCHGTRLRKDVQYVKINGKSMVDLLTMPIDELVEFFNNIQLTEYEQKATDRILKEIKNRLHYLMQVGLGYLTLNRQASTLSGGEAQRIVLSTSIGSPLVGSMYILDEPTIGLHTIDTNNLIQVLKDLRDEGNTVIVVEHDEDVIRNADYVIDIGPFAGKDGGEVVFAGTQKELQKSKTSLTAQYMRKEKEIPLSSYHRNSREYLEIKNVFDNNLNNVTFRFPLNEKVVVCGVSGSGKSTLVNKVFVNALKMQMDISTDYHPKCSEVMGSVDLVKDIQLVDQNSIARSSRSNPALYTGLFDDVRNLFANQPLAKARGLKPGYFSFNVEGGRCETCKGDGVVDIHMQFMADVTLECEECHGKRYKEDALEIKFKDKNVSDILQMTIDEAAEFFSQEEDNSCKKIYRRLSILQQVGLGYLQLGQSLSTVSGGEAQRIKLATFLDKGSSLKHTLFVFDEPTTGLHFHDISKLNDCFDALIRNGHSVLIIEHHLDIIKTADWLIELGPGGGKHGGKIVFEGTIDQMKDVDTATSRFLKEKLQ